MTIFHIIHEKPSGVRYDISQDQIVRIQDEALALETRITELETANRELCDVIGGALAGLGYLDDDHGLLVIANTLPVFNMLKQTLFIHDRARHAKLFPGVSQ